MAESGMFNGWHLKKEVSIGHIGATLMVALSVIWAWSSLQERISINEVRIKATTERISAMEVRTDDRVRDLISEVRALRAEVATELRALRESLSKSGGGR